MIGTIITLGIFCLVFGIMIVRQFDKNAALTADNALLKGRMEAMTEAAATKPAEDGKSLTVEGIADAVRHVGYKPDCGEDWVAFNVGDERYEIDADWLPTLFVTHLYTIDKEKWDLDIMKKAAHIMSDELAMVKALIRDDQEKPTLRFFIAALDRTSTSLKYNIKSYLGSIDNASRRMIEIYDKLMEEQNPSTQLVNSVTDTIKANDTIAS